MIYFQLFLSFLQIGAFSFGGGYAAMPLIQNQVVDLHHWLNLSEFTDLVTISQMTPGPIAINSATFVGTRIAGAPGALAATVGCVLPSCILVTLLARIYLKYRDLSIIQGVLKSLRPAVVAMIGAAGVSAVPMAARVVQKEGQKYNPSNFLLMHAMGPNVAGVIGSAVAAGMLLLFFR